MLTRVLRGFLILLILSLGTLGSRAAEPNLLQDPIAGIELRLPARMPGTATETTNGVNWRSRDGRLDVDTLRFPPERTLDAIRDKLKSIPGRQIIREDLTPQSLLLSGRDERDRFFIVKILAQPDGSKRGVSVVFEARKGADALRRVAQSIIGSLRSTDVAMSGPVADDRSGFRPVQLRGSLVEPSYSTPPNAEALCRQQFAALQKGALQVQLRLPDDAEITAGEVITLSWDAPNVSWPKGASVYLQIDVPVDAELPLKPPSEDDYHVRIFEWTPNDRSEYGSLSDYPEEPETKRVTLALNAEQGVPARSLSLLFSKAGPVRLTATVFAAATYGFSGQDVAADCRAARLTLPLVADLRITPAPPRYSSPRACHLTPERAAQLSGSIALTAAKSATEGVPSGEPLELKWSAGAAIDRSCKTPLYLVLSLPGRVRFAGDGFIALNAGAEAPFGLPTDADETRVLVPLHAGERSRNGKLKVRFFDAGQWPIGARLVEVPAWSPLPLTAADFAGERPVVAALAGTPIMVAVRPAAPRIIVQDQFTTETPSRTVQSSDGSYVLQTFREYYRVLDARTRNLVIQRTGTRPEFSITGRYVAAQLENEHSFEIIDLTAGARVAGFRSEEQGSYIGRGILPIAWGRNDSFVLAAPNNGDGLLYNLLVDRDPITLAMGGAKHSTVKPALVYVDLENFAVASKRFPDRASTEAGRVSLLAGSGDNAENMQPAFGLIAQHWPQFASQAFRWHLGEDTRFGNIPDKPDLAALLKEGESTDWADAAAKERWIDETTKEFERNLAGYNYVTGQRVTHEVPTAGAAPYQVASANRLTEVREQARSSDTDRGRSSKRTIDQLMRLAGLSMKANLAKAAALGPLYEGRYASLKGDTTPDPALNEVLLEHVNSSAYQAMLAKMHADLGTDETKPKRYADLSEVPAEFGCQYYTPDGSFGAFVSPLRVLGRTGWQSGDNRFWLIQQDCWGGSGWRSGQLGLLIKRPGQTPEFHSLTQGLDDKDLDTFGLNSAKLARGWMTDDEVLLVAMPNSSILVHDVRASRRVALLEKVEGAEFSADLRLAPDLSKLVMLTEGGRIGIFDLTKGVRPVSGYYVDDELILYTDGGHYLSTPEGAHFVNVKFPGLPAHNTVHQFARTLNRPDLIRDILAGKAAPERPRLTPPPLLDIEAGTTGGAGARAAHIAYKASSASGLERLVLHVDGRPVREIALSGERTEGAVDVEVASEARWISAIAIDRAGYESVPQVEAIAGAGRPSGRLFVVAVGTDIYDQLTAKEQLSGAVVDARHFEDAARTLSATIYSDVIVTELLDDPDLKVRLPAALREVVAAADRDDTIMLFAAGHGKQGEDGRFYLLPRTFRPGATATTALAWEEIGAAFEGVKGRVVVFLDACRSGAVAGAAGNDDAVSALIGGRPPLTVIAASKGRQDSKEAPGGQGGRFTNALIRAISADRSATDTNSNGAIELAELYGVVKREVVQVTRAEQTPWIARNQMVGEIPLF